MLSQLLQQKRRNQLDKGKGKIQMRSLHKKTRILKSEMMRPMALMGSLKTKVLRTRPPMQMPTKKGCTLRLHERITRTFDLGKGNFNSAGTAIRYTPPLYIKRKAVSMLEDGEDLETIRQIICHLTREKCYIMNMRQLNNWMTKVNKF